MKDKLVEGDHLAANILSGADAARKIARGELTSEALIRACLNRIRERESDVHAWAWIDPTIALDQARARDRETPRGLLHGLPIGVKDVIDTNDMPTEYNSCIYRGHRPSWDASCVAILRDAGCVILGKTVTTELASSNSGAQTRNPHNLAHTPGGSSSGSAAAVADYMTSMALGTQTGGSLIRPAAFCGVVGYKPTFGTVSRAGLKFVSESLDTIGIHCRKVEDAALMTNVLSGREIPDLESARSAPHVGFCRTPRWNQVAEEAQVELERGAMLMRKSGARISDLEFVPDEERLLQAHSTIIAFESARLLAWEYRRHGDKLSEGLAKQLDRGWAIPRKAYDEARRDTLTSRRRVAEQMQDFDFLLTPSAPGEAPKSLQTTGSSLFNRFWTLLGLPCVTLPSGKGSHGLPLGFQMIGHFDADGDLLAWAHWLEGKLGPSSS